jgi:hypothetical protein
MHDPLRPMRPLQNHFPVATHLTTLAGLWMPQ